MSTARSWLSVKEVATQCGVTADAVQKKLQAGLLKGEKVNNLGEQVQPHERGIWHVDAQDVPVDNLAWRTRFPPGRPWPVVPLLLA